MERADLFLATFSIHLWNFAKLDQVESIWDERFEGLNKLIMLD